MQFQDKKTCFYKHRLSCPAPELLQLTATLVGDGVARETTGVLCSCAFRKGEKYRLGVPYLKGLGAEVFGTLQSVTMRCLRDGTQAKQEADVRFMSTFYTSLKGVSCNVLVRLVLTVTCQVMLPVEIATMMSCQCSKCLGRFGA